jgi:hypothetical protein
LGWILHRLFICSSFFLSFFSTYTYIYIYTICISFFCQKIWVFNWITLHIAGPAPASGSIEPGADLPIWWALAATRPTLWPPLSLHLGEICEEEDDDDESLRFADDAMRCDERTGLIGPYVSLMEVQAPDATRKLIWMTIWVVFVVAVIQFQYSTVSQTTSAAHELRSPGCWWSRTRKNWGMKLLPRPTLTYSLIIQCLISYFSNLCFATLLSLIFFLYDCKSGKRGEWNGECTQREYGSNW